jgi:trk system potassium uptake protein TrkH
MGRFTPPQILIFSFLCVIAAGTVLLALPAATQGPEKLPLIDSLFTATSATCVTGLIVRDTGSYFSSFGRWVIFALFQAGGLGIMTFSTLFAVLLGKRLGFHQGDIIKSTLDKNSITGLGKLIKYILTATLAVEGITALFLFFRWRAITDWGILENLEQSVFHAVSAFCNAGFSLFRDSFIPFAADPCINLIMMAAIIAGGIGFVVMFDLAGRISGKSRRGTLSLQSRTAIHVSLYLIAAGALLFYVFEQDNVLRGMSVPAAVWPSLFQSVTARTAGFNTVPIGQLTAPALFSIIFLMFVGASPGSTGGGIKTSTFAVILANMSAKFHNRGRTRLFHRSVPLQVVRESMVICFLALSWIFMVGLVFMFVGRYAGERIPFIQALFEMVSAFGTVGLSTGITAGLNTAGKICIIVTMFVGRLGPLTLALAVAVRETKESYVFPEENLMVG